MGNVIRITFRRIKSRRGQGMVEYGLIIAFVAIILVSVLGLIHEPVTQIFAAVAEALGIAP